MNPWGSKSLYRCTLVGSRAGFRPRYNIRRLMRGQALLFGRPALTRASEDTEGGRHPPSTRRLVYGRLSPSRPQERFRT